MSQEKLYGILLTSDVAHMTELGKRKRNALPLYYLHCLQPLSTKSMPTAFTSYLHSSDHASCHPHHINRSTDHADSLDIIVKAPQILLMSIRVHNSSETMLMSLRVHSSSLDDLVYSLCKFGDKSPILWCKFLKFDKKSFVSHQKVI